MILWLHYETLLAGNVVDNNSFIYSIYLIRRKSSKATRFLSDFSMQLSGTRNIFQILSSREKILNSSRGEKHEITPAINLAFDSVDFHTREHLYSGKTAPALAPLFP